MCPALPQPCQDNSCQISQLLPSSGRDLVPAALDCCNDASIMFICTSAAVAVAVAWPAMVAIAAAVHGHIQGLGGPSAWKDAGAMPSCQRYTVHLLFQRLCHFLCPASKSQAPISKSKQTKQNVHCSLCWLLLGTCCL